MKISNILKLIIAVLICEIIGMIGSLFTIPAIAGWYAYLVKPELAPPNWIFGPVWTLLFMLMGIAMYLVLKKGLERRDIKIALCVFACQLLLNSLWSVIFFGLRRPGVAFIEIIFLWIAILTTIIIFAKISKSAAWLLTPYILWVTFAAYLNYAIYSLN